MTQPQALEEASSSPWPHWAGHPQVTVAVSPAPWKETPGGNQFGCKALLQNVTVAASLPLTRSPFPAGPRERKWQQHVRSAADGWCVMGTAGQIWHTGVSPVPASCPTAPRYLWPRDERGEESPSSLHTREAAVLGESVEGSKPFPPRSSGPDCPAREGMRGLRAEPGGCCLANQLSFGSPTGTAKLAWPWLSTGEASAGPLLQCPW